MSIHSSFLRALDAIRERGILEIDDLLGKVLEHSCHLLAFIDPHELGPSLIEEEVVHVL